MEASDYSVNRLVLKAEGLSRTFNRRNIFKDISFSVGTGDSLAITGKNGSGKSTLIKILAGLLSPSGGTVHYQSSGAVVSMDGVHRTMGFVAPYFQLYDEFTALENIELAAKIRSSRSADMQRAEHLLRRFSLWNRRNDFVRGYSSGMKQRLKYIVALEHEPQVLMLDEPSANLDEEGTGAVRDIVSGRQGSVILVVATNDEREALWCSKRVHMGA